MKKEGESFLIPPLLQPYHSGGATASASSVAILMHPTAGMSWRRCNPFNISCRGASSRSSPATLRATRTCVTNGDLSSGCTNGKYFSINESLLLCRLFVIVR